MSPKRKLKRKPAKPAASQSIVVYGTLDHWSGTYNAAGSKNQFKEIELRLAAANVVPGEIFVGPVKVTIHPLQKVQKVRR